MASIESLSASLVREFLSRKGLKRSLRVLDDEFPREENSVRNRLVLAKELKIEKLMRLNKETGNPLRTMIEVVVNFLMNEKAMKRTNTGSKENIKLKKSQEKLANISPDHINTTIGQQSDTTLDFSDRIGEKTRNSAYKSRHLKSESLDTDLFHLSKMGQTKSLDHLGSYDESENVSVARRREKSNPLSDDVSTKKVTSRGSIQNTSERSQRRGMKKSMDLNSNRNFLLSEDLDSESKGNAEPMKIASQNGRWDEDDISTVKKQEASVFRIEDLREKKVRKNRNEKAASDTLVFDEFQSDIFDDTADLKIGQPKTTLMSKLFDKSSAITLELASSLKTLVFGSASKSFNAEWMSQSFSFCDVPGLEYGIVQIKGGPCGVLATVQATLLKSLMFKKGRRSDLSGPPIPSSKERTNALVEAIAEMLWRAGAKKSAAVATSSMKEKFVGGGRCKSDGITETLMIYQFTSDENLRAFILQNISQFESGSGCGCILFLYSLVLSRTIQRIKGEMDEVNGTLIGAHGYCTQELVNLCLTGEAVSNVFDGTIELDSGGIEKSVLKGIEMQSDIGLLSLFEHYESCKVGEHLKNPKYPIWVVCSESHFSTLFNINPSLLKDRALQRRFDLYYYDGLARQDEEIRLTIDTRMKPELDEDDLIPPLEHCIRTKWNDAVVSWNDTEPIL